MIDSVRKGAAQPVEDRLLDLSRFDGASVSVEELRCDRSGGNDSLSGGIVCGYGRRSENRRRDNQPGLPEQAVVEGFPQPSELAAGIL